MKAVNFLFCVRDKCNVSAVPPCRGTAILRWIKVYRRHSAFFIGWRFSRRLGQARKAENSKNLIVEATGTLYVIGAERYVADDGHDYLSVFRGENKA